MRSSGFPLVAAVALATAALAGCGKSDQGSGSGTQAGAPAAPAAEPSDADRQKLLASLPAPYNQGDLANGKKQFGLCRSCHTIAQGAPNMTGPNLYGVFGRKAGAVEGFNYSQAVKTAGFTWDAEHLDQWLARPATYMPGTRMSFAGLKDPAARRDLIAYLKVETGYQP
jgi:cytochrome c